MNEINQDEDFLDSKEALSLFKALMKENGTNIKTTLELLFPKQSIRTLQNKYGTLLKGTDARLAKPLIKAIKEYRANPQKEISFSDLTQFFISKNVCKAVNEEDKQLQGSYLLFRYNIDGKIVVSYVEVLFDGRSLLFKSERNNINTSRDVVPIHISTEGVVIKNKDALYLFIGISRNVNDTAMSFIETLKIAKNDSGSSLPNTGYFHGILAPGKSNDPFISKIVLIKIKDKKSKEFIEKDLSSNEKKEHKIIRTHEISKLLDTKYIVNHIVSLENKNETGNAIYTMENILERLTLEIPKEDFFFTLHKF